MDKHIYTLFFSGNYFGVPLENPQFQELENNSSLNDFLDSGSTQILGSHFLPSEKRIIFTSRVIIIKSYDINILSYGTFTRFRSTSTNEKSLVFFKIKPTVITKENLDEIFVSSMLDSPISSLYHSLQKLYAPVLLRVRERVFVKELKVKSILEVKDELQFWTEVANKPKSRDEKEIAKAFYQALEPIAKELRKYL
ncbi:hypothetical protein Anas_05734 [Armadillidium nasatum]|uniref:Uncharacterized protein n=1 Tax=Armadillidium nasatum TaxID=96803 RepID=A0A5N5TH06_9CRUS|nr:hypothetical protein Anas_05734 [Armadillidium nasatum]